MIITSRLLRFTGAALLALGLAACSGAGDDAAMADGAAGASGAAAGALGTGGPSDPSSVEYFQVNVGDRVFFATDSSTLTPDAQETLRAQARWLNANPSRSAIIEGHADADPLVPNDSRHNRAKNRRVELVKQ